MIAVENNVTQNFRRKNKEGMRVIPGYQIRYQPRIWHESKLGPW